MGDPIGDATLDRKTRRTERSRRWEPVSRRGKAAQITTGACLAFAATLTVWSAWAELTCPYGGPAGREWCRTTVGVGGIFVMAGIGVAALGTVIAVRGLLRPVDPVGGDGWTWGEGVLIALAGLVLGLMVIDSPVCPAGYDMATGFDLCIARGDASVRVEATSRLALQLSVVLAGTALGLVVAMWHRFPWILGAATAAVATAAGTLWFLDGTVGLPW